ncbi:MAG: glutamate--tRNA ligase, partial [Gordonia sp. (in: high G+C Gram-positive bacteria)]
LMAFLYVPDSDFAIDETAARKNLGADAGPVLDATIAALSALDEWTTPAIEAGLKDALVDKLELKPRKAFGPVRVAVTGSHISPPLFESLELLGEARSLDRLRLARANFC